MATGFNVDGDVQLSPDGQDVWLPDPLSPEGICESVRVAAETIQTTWRYDLKRGMPWLNDQIMRQSNEALIRALWYDMLRATPGIDKVGQVSLTYSGATRNARVSWTAYTKQGLKLHDDLPLQLQ